MQGMRFLIVGENGPMNHGIIVSSITAEKYLCSFARVPQSSRVCDLEEIQQWNLFPTDDAMNTFISELGKEQKPVADPTPTTAADKKKAKKKVQRKVRQAAVKRGKK